MTGGDDEEAAPLEDLADRRPEDAAPVDAEGSADEREADADGEIPRRERAPLEEIAGEVRRRRDEREAAEPEEGDLFEEMDVADVDAEAVWESLFAETEAEEATGKAVGAGAAAERAGTAAGADPREEFVVPKENYCERCPYLGDPPRLTCTHENTEIVAVVDSEHFRVRGCPFTGEEVPTFDDLE